MPIYRAVGSWDASAPTPGLQSCVDPVHGTFDPTFIVLLPTPNAPGTSSAHFQPCIGFAAKNGASTTQFAMGIRSADADSGGSDLKVTRTTALAWSVPGLSATYFAGTVTFGTGGFTPIPSATNTGVVHWIAFGGDVTAAQVVKFQMATAGSSTISHALGAAPDLAIFPNASLASGGDGEIGYTDLANISWSLGFQERDGGTKGCTSLRAVISADPTTLWTSQRTDSAYQSLLSGTIGAEFSVSAWGTSDITLTYGTNPSSAYWTYAILVRGGKWRVTPVVGGTGTVDTAVLSGHTPVAAVAESNCLAPSASPGIVDGDTFYNLGLAASVSGGVTQNSIFGSDDDAAATTDANKCAVTSLFYVGALGASPLTEVARANAEFPSGNIRAVWSPADSVGRQWLVLTALNQDSIGTSGTVDVTVPAAQVEAFAPTSGTSGTVGVTAQAPDATVTGFLPHVPLGSIVLSGDAVDVNVGAVNASLSPVSVAAAGQLPNGGDVVAGSAAPTIAAVGTVTIVGTSTLTATAPTIDAVGTIAVLGDVVAGSAVAEVAATGTSVVTGSVAMVTALPAADVTSSSTTTGAVDAAVPVASVDAVGTLAVMGSVGVIAQVPVVVATTSTAASGTVAAASSAAYASLQGSPRVPGTATLTAPASEVLASAGAAVVGTVGAVAPYGHAHAEGTPAVVGASSAVVPGPEVVASGAGATIVGTATLAAHRAAASLMGAPLITGTTTIVGQPSWAFLEGGTAGAGSVAARAALPILDAAGTLHVIGSADLRSRLPRTSGFSTTVIFGSVAASPTAAQIRARNFLATWYLSVNEDQYPFDMDNDSEGRRQYAFNVSVDKMPSATFPEELAYYLEQRGVTYPILLGSQAAVPRGDGPFITITQTGGLRGVRVQNRTTPARERPSAQVLVRAKSSRVSKNVSYELYQLLADIRNQELVVPAWALE